FTGFARTLSFALAEGARRYGQTFVQKGAVIEQIRSGWVSARELSNQSVPELPSTAINDVWAVLLHLISDGTNPQQASAPEPLLTAAVEGVRTHGLVPKEVWTKLAARVLRDVPSPEALEGPREARVRAVESAIRDLTHRREGSRWERAFVA